MYEREILRLRKVIREWEKKQEEFKDLPELKKRLREELKFELDKDRKVEDMILREKVASAKEELNKLKKEREDLLEQLHISKEEAQKRQGEIKALQEQLKKGEQLLDLTRKEVSKNDEELKRLKDRNLVLEDALKSKTEIISKLQEQMKVLDINYITLKSKHSDN